MMVLALCVSMNTFAHQINMNILQDNTEGEPHNSSYLVNKYYDIPDNKYELIYIFDMLQNNNFANEADMEKAVVECHKYFVEHQDEILTSIKADELLQYRNKYQEIREKRRSEMWAPLLSALPGIISNATMAGLNAGQLQQQQYQQRLNRDKETQAFLASHSSKPSYKEYKQDFGSAQNTNTKSSYRKVTTSNGFDEPLPSAPASNTPQQNYSGVQSSNNRRVTTSNGFDEPLPSAPASIRPDNVSSINSGEKVVQGIFVYNSQQAVVRLRYYNGQITAYSTSRDALNREQWISIYPDTPHLTMEIQDGNLARDYKYKVSGDGKVFLFNL